MVLTNGAKKARSALIKQLEAKGFTHIDLEDISNLPNDLIRRRIDVEESSLWIRAQDSEFFIKENRIVQLADLDPHRNYNVEDGTGIILYRVPFEECGHSGNAERGILDKNGDPFTAPRAQYSSAEVILNELLDK